MACTVFSHSDKVNDNTKQKKLQAQKNKKTKKKTLSSGAGWGRSQGLPWVGGGLGGALVWEIGTLLPQGGGATLITLTTLGGGVFLEWCPPPGSKVPIALRRQGSGC